MGRRKRQDRGRGRDRRICIQSRCSKSSNTQKNVPAPHRFRDGPVVAGAQIQHRRAPVLDDDAADHLSVAAEVREHVSQRALRLRAYMSGLARSTFSRTSQIAQTSRIAQTNTEQRTRHSRPPRRKSILARQKISRTLHTNRSTSKGKSELKGFGPTCIPSRQCLPW